MLHYHYSSGNDRSLAALLSLGRVHRTRCLCFPDFAPPQTAGPFCVSSPGKKKSPASAAGQELCCRGTTQTDYQGRGAPR